MPPKCYSLLPFLFRNVKAGSFPRSPIDQFYNCHGLTPYEEQGGEAFRDEMHAEKSTDW
jgi:hypothetical protein